MAREEAKEEDEDTTDNLGLTLEGIEQEVLSDADFEEHFDMLEEMSDEDADTIKALLREDEQ